LTFGKLPVLIAALLCLALALPAQEASIRPIKLKVSADQANLREKPDIGSAVIQQVPEGTVLESDRKEGEWYLVRYTLEDGGVIAGYIHESLVTVLETALGAPGQPAREVKPEARRPESEPRPAPPFANNSPRDTSLLPIDVFISAGVGPVLADDLNKGSRGLADLNGASLGLSPSGSIGSLHLTGIVGVEAAFRASRWLSLGLGADFERGWRSSRVVYEAGGLLTPTLATTAKPSVQVLPVRLSLRFYPRPDFYFRASAVHYTVKVGYDDRLVSSATTWQEWHGRATAHTLGMEVAAGGEWRVAAHSFIFAEAGFRLTPAVHLSGTGTVRDSSGAEESEAGPLWFYQQRGADGSGHDLLFVHAAQPSGTDILGVRKASLTLSGMALRLGVKIRL
jgi:hypothetical protein